MRPERRVGTGVLFGLGLGLCVCAAPVWAQSALIEPRLAAQLSWSDNLDTTEHASRSGFVAELVPGLRIARDGSRLSGTLDASLRGSVDFGDRDQDEAYLALIGRGRAVLVEDSLFLDADALVTRDNPSAFSGRARGDALNRDEAQELRSLGVSPRLALRLGDTRLELAYLARLIDGGEGREDGEGGFERQRLGRWTLDVGDAAAFGRAGWTFNYLRSDTAYGESGRRDVSEQSARAVLLLRAWPELRLRAIAGYESNDYAARRDESGRILGAGLDWTPNPRTTLAATVEDRIFGRAYDLRLDYRRTRSAWTLGASRDIRSSFDSLASIYDDPDYRLLFDALTSSYPDPLEREREARRQLGFPQAGLGDATVSGSHYLERRLHAALAWTGRRNSVRLNVQRSDRERLGSAGALNALDDLSRYPRVRELRAGLSFAHRLSAQTSLTVAASRSHARGEGDERARTRRSLLTLGLSTRLGPSTTGALGYRYQRVSGADPYTENAIIVTLLMRF